ncbi:MAG: hypothetical protein HETSPECPRED_004798 [Heterodermia speciosa]|uniref:Uncharacterized protein n=1 Tax=Heterodermia speciosa TaxID=116794 RepID=A0A8H3EHT8_9LECA|nr:MAG: hypothetical protein HETSPECPRED_004798 [Heterodermia speciosa]
MPTTTTFFRRFATLLSTGLLLAHSANAAVLNPKTLLVRDGSLLPRQQPCQKATLDVSEDKIIQDTCGSNPQNNYSQCHDQL